MSLSENKLSEPSSSPKLLRVALVGLGKMGLSHCAIVRSHPGVDLVAVCDVSDYVLGALNKYTGIKTYSNYSKLLDHKDLEAVFIASPPKLHGQMVRQALQRGLHVFCEKPFCLDPDESFALAELAESKGLIGQVGYHFRFVATFQEMKRLLAKQEIGKIHHIRTEAYGPVVLKPKISTWRSAKDEGGGCLYDYASHAIDLANFLVGPPEAVSGTVLSKVFSQDVDDEVYSTMLYRGGMTGQIAANWSDESLRKMSMKVTIWGTKGRMTADRQELQIYLREKSRSENLQQGWNVRYTTELTKEVWFYLRGEEYSAQIDHFVESIAAKKPTICSFRDAAQADRITAIMIKNATMVSKQSNSAVSEKGPDQIEIVAGYKSAIN